MQPVSNPDNPAVLPKIRIVMVRTSHPGNIGSAARAMKTMGLTQLYLVNPADLSDIKMAISTGQGKAHALASGATDVLQQATLCQTLDEALQGCTLVIGASARLRTIQWPQLNPTACAGHLLAQAGEGADVALLVGNEQSGLDNSELDHCHYLTHIEANPDYTSLNVAMAVQVFCWEIRKAWLAMSKADDNLPEARLTEGNRSEPVPTDTDEALGEALASHEEVERFLEHLRYTMIDIGFLGPTKQNKQLLRRLRRLFNRARLGVREVNILRGILSAAQGHKSAQLPDKSKASRVEAGETDQASPNQ